MSALLDRVRARIPDARADDQADDTRPLPLTAVLAAGWAAGAGLALCVSVALAGWLVGSTGSVADAVRVGAQAWLLGLGSGLRVGAVTVTAVPLGLTVLFAALLWRSGAWAASSARVDDVRTALSGTAIVAAVHAVIATAAALFTATDSSSVSPLRAFGCALLLAAVFAGIGMLRGADLLAALWQTLPEYARAALRGGLAAVLLTVAAGALLVTVALAVDLGDAANVAHAMSAGLVGGAILTLAGVLLLPNAALFAVAYLLGPGFAFGSGTTVAPSGASLGRVPAFPLLAALPDQGAAPWWAAALLAVPVLAGAAGAVVALRHHPVAGLAAAALRGALTGAVAGIATGLLTALAGGSIGPERMADTGAQVLACTGIAVLAMTLGGAAGGLLTGRRVRRTG